MRRVRTGRPSLIGTAARTAVVVGTATAVSGAVADSAQQKAAAQQAAAQQVTAMQAQQEAANPPGGAIDQIEQLKKLAELQQMGVLNEAEFADLKAKILAGK